MENKKLLKFLLRDLSELEELVTEKGDNGFDELEMEFLQTRVSGAKRMIQILFNNENSSANINIDKQEIIAPENIQRETVVQKETFKKPIIVEDKAEAEPENKEEFVETEKEVREEVEDALDRIEETEERKTDKEAEKKAETEIETVEENEVELNEKKVIIEANQRLGDSFSKEKSVNDLIDTENTKLEQKISNRPVKSIKTAIGINDKFLFIRELFEGNAEVFTKAIAVLDAKKDINEAVKYLQQNFKWKKNETSLKFVNLVKRRFSNE